MIERLRPFVVPAVLLGLLEVWARTLGIGSDAFAAPTAAGMALAGALSDGTVLLATTFTLSTATTGLGLGFALAIVLGTVLGLSQHLAGVTFLSVEVIRPLPAVAFIPLATLVWGFGFRMEVAVVAFACFWPLLILTQNAVRQVEPRLLEVARALQLSPVSRFFKIVLPAMAPRLFVALRLGISIALVVSVTVEIAVNPFGMGYALVSAQQALDPALMLAWLFWISILGFVLNAGAERAQFHVSARMGGQRQ